MYGYILRSKDVILLSAGELTVLAPLVSLIFDDSN